jgi:hypothetical protein
MPEWDIAKPRTFEQQLADANFTDQVRTEERKRCALVILQHRHEITAEDPPSLFRLMLWLEADNGGDFPTDQVRGLKAHEVTEAAGYAELPDPEAEDWDIAVDIPEDTAAAAAADPDREAAMQLCAGHRVDDVLFERIVEFVAGRRLWREENERLRRLAEQAELKVTRIGDFLRTAIGILDE